MDMKVAVYGTFWCLSLFGTDVAQDADQRIRAEKVRDIFESACHRCHGDKGTIEGGFGYVLNRGQLIARKQILVGDASKSRLMRRILKHEMPPEGESPRLTGDDIELISEWIDKGAYDFNPSKANREFIETAAMLKSMREDLKQKDVADRPFVRYLTLTHLYNAGRSEDELQGYRNGIVKLVNSLSWGRRVVVPTAIGTGATILRIDIRDYKWSSAIWDQISTADPYGLTYPASSDAKELYSETGSALPYVRGDWFVYAAARPPLYHQILQLPLTVKELESLLHVDVEENLRTGQSARSGFNGSAISRNNRLIERHESSYGYYWKSYDFAKNIDRQNLFAHPLGPGASDRDFRHDGGELIFSLPNGFQAYMLVNEAGQRIDKGPTEIVSDLKRPDRTVENGLSCMSCHVRGILPKDDQIRLHLQKNPSAFSKKESEQINKLYPSRERFQTLVDDDAAAFRRAVDLAKIPPSRNEPINELATLFESELDLPLAAAEAGFKPDEFQKVLRQSADLARVLGSLQSAEGTTQRDLFANSFADLVRVAKLGTPLTHPPRNPPVVAEGKSAAKPKPVAVLGKGKNLSSAVWINPGGTPEKGGGLRFGGSVISKDKNFLNKNFTFEAILTLKAGDPIAVIGIGDNSTAQVNPGYAFKWRIHPPGLSDGQVYVTNQSTTLGVPGSAMPQPGTHLFRITKVDDMVTFQVDVDNDGESPDDSEYTFDIKETLPKLHAKNTYLFFGAGLYQSVSLTIEK